MARPRSTTKKPEHQVAIRFPEGLHEELKDAARASMRSTNAEIIARLQNSIRPETDPGLDAIRQAVREELAGSDAASADVLARLDRIDASLAKVMALLEARG